MARLLGGEVSGDGVKCPGPGHDPKDRSLSVKPDANDPEGFVCNPFSPRDDWRECRDMVRQKLGLPKWEPKTKAKKKNGKLGGKAYSPTIAKYIYRTAHGEPYLCVHRTVAKDFPQYHWDGQLWKAGAPKGERIPYRLPELLAASKSTPVYITEGEGKADLLAKLDFVATSAAGGAGKWTSDLNEHFKDRPIIILPDNDKPGFDHAQLVARNLDAIATSVKVVELPDLPPKGDVKQWLQHDPTGARLVQISKAAPGWEPLSEAETAKRNKEVDEALISELAALSKLDYGKRRKSAAEEIGIAVSILDSIVAEARGEPKPDEEWAVEPWPEPVATADLLNDLRDTYSAHVILLDGCATTMALWNLHAWTIDAFNVSPFLFFTSPMMRCGKSTALMLLNRTAPRTALASNISTAAIFRYIERYHPTLIVDEADSFVAGAEDMRGILNSGHTRDTAFVIRCDGESMEPRKFSTWAPKVIAAIGKLAPTLVDRSIVISMRRRKPSEKVAKLRARDTEAFETLRRKCARWSADHLEQLREARPEIPEALNDRAGDNWEPLLAIADLAGPDWARAARVTAVALSADPTDEGDNKVLLLSDMRDIFTASKADAITSKRLLERLHDDEMKPWAAFGRSAKPISERQVAKLLAEFKVYPKNVRISGEQAKGYTRASLAEAFERYLSPTGGDASVPASQCSDINDLEQELSVPGKSGGTDENAPNPLQTNDWDAGTDERAPPGEKPCRHACDYCKEPPDGTEQMCALADRTAWLHPRCQHLFLDAQEDGFEIPEFLRRCSP
jgi:putative DNA primase/helicase